jgi:uncharacterized protein (DUF2236 family)
MEFRVQPISQEEIERLWDLVAKQTANPQAGIFGPSFVSWKVNRESALFLGAGRAALLQLAHPWVATALDQHSSLLNDPLARFHNTFRVVFTMIFGTLDQALAASRHLYHLHMRIQGELPESIAAYARGSHYAANELNALVWVYATLIESALLAYETVLPPLSNGERDSYYAESKTLAALFGIPLEALPPDWPQFESWMRAMLASDALGVNALSRAMAHSILRGSGSWVPVPDWYRALTAASMPERFRGEFSLVYGEREERAAAKARSWLQQIYKHLPAALRFVGPYQEAQSRLLGRRANLLTRSSNRFWTGQTLMMFGEPRRESEQ